MPLRDDPEIMRLAAEHEGLRRLVEEHTQLDKKVAALDKRHVRTPAEEMERKRLSKLKLADRDKIAKLVAELKSRR